MPHFFRRLSPALLSLLFLLGCTKSAPATEPPSIEDPTDREIQALSEETDRLTLWTVYWDTLGKAATLRNAGDKISEVVLFAASYEEDQITVPDATLRLLERLRNTPETDRAKIYLSVVNDLVSGGETSQKDTELLYRLLGTEEKAKAHARELVTLTKEQGFDGIEIDFEKIRKDLDLWENFFCFEKALLEYAEEENLAVRILLEPGTPVDKLTFPEGPQYVVMCYNLYGGGTTPGPKADTAFLKELCEKFAPVPNLGFALANGGYSWTGLSTKASQLRSEEATQLAFAHNCTPERDPDSNALYFTYKDGGQAHTVWYADDTTLASWARTLREQIGAQVPISLWRI